MKPRSRPMPLALLALSLVLGLGIALHYDRQPVHGILGAPGLGDRLNGNGVVSLQLESYAGGLSNPVGIANAGDMRLFVIEQAGIIRIVNKDGTVREQPFLDIRGKVDDSSSEQGLLGLAFHPDYFENGHFYLNYTNTTDGMRRTRISRFSVSVDPNIADATSEHILLTVDQPYANHNAGRIVFGPDGYLYIPLGDGGSGGDPGNYAQTMDVLLGKISRIDVDKSGGGPADCQGEGSGAYTIPSDNPYVSGPGKECDEIWASGLRNPWQSTFDSKTGDLFIADVGQSLIEEVNLQPTTSSGGENYGWRCYEGSEDYLLSGCQAPSAYTFPIFEYNRQNAFGDCSVTGGYVYRGRQFPALYGRYFLTDYCSGRFWDLQRLADGNWQPTVHNNVFPPGETSKFGNAAFGQRCDGELFVANRSLGKVFHLAGQGVLNDSQANGLVAADHWIYLPLVIMPNCR